MCQGDGDSVESVGRELRVSTNSSWPNIGARSRRARKSVANAPSIVPPMQREELARGPKKSLAGELLQLARKELDERGLAVAIWRVATQAVEWMLVAPRDSQGDVQDKSTENDKR